MKKAFTAIVLFSLLSSICMSEVVPFAKISLDRLLNTPSLSEFRKGSPALHRVLLDFEGAALAKPHKPQMTIVCQEILSDEGYRYQMPPNPHVVGRGEQWSDDGSFVRVYEAYTGTASKIVNGRKQTVHTFLLSIDYSWGGRRGILLVPFWAHLDRTEAKNPKIKHWEVDSEKVSIIEQGEQDGGGQPATRSESK